MIHAPGGLERPPFWTAFLLALSLLGVHQHPSGMSTATGAASAQRRLGPIDHRTSLHNVIPIMTISRPCLPPLHAASPPGISVRPSLRL
ncbi:uncharacterized protein J3D65DRAFT_628179 [Phyllosticta citribraziliensis]|uniref:Secreted protein n=1 Tax=Phyllosticta citribraziliensis TaxID=989973 RepID=A0ABR1LM93_9PEZI